LTLDRLNLEGVRNLETLALSPGPGINWFWGQNGAGKTSVLEAIYLLARGRSFRASRPASVIQHQADQLRIVARRSDQLMLGVERSGETWRGRLGGRECRRISEFAARLPLVLIEPDSHRLVDGGPDRRRQYLDWLLFHVEPDYLEAWQRYARLLRQRNAALKSRADDRLLDALDQPLVQSAGYLDRLREHQIGVLSEALSELLLQLGLRLPGEIVLGYRRGFPKDQALADSLKEQRSSDRERGFTQRGPHRADLILKVDGHAAATELSRGQQKLLALALQLTQLRILTLKASTPPMLLLDDPVSELDADHLGRVLSWLQQQGCQSWVTATTQPPLDCTMFHVEQGRIRI